MGLTCVACSLVFSTRAVQKEHYSTLFHRYNMARKLQGLEPVSEGVFEEKNRKPEQVGGKKEMECVTCCRTFQSENTFRSHIQSKKNSCSGEWKEPGRAETRTQETVLGEGSCLFCAENGPGQEDLLDHMWAAHGFFVPNRENIADLAGLLRFLRKWVGEYKQCLHCGDAAFFPTVDAAQRHMRKRAHCNIRYEEKKIAGIVAEYYKEDMWVDEPATLTDSLNIRLPSGTVIGWRPGKRRTFSSSVRASDRPRLTVARKISKKEKCAEKKHNDAVSRWLLCVGKKKNNLKHFRSQNQ
ncbi:MAG: C2H2-type zinc finger-containing protein [Amphiamblys sp. WSBS2006]|nr:MAG: C2H2-type zinc finger-containing protein [Amphiamblys sp. WSBS2006]